MKKTIELSQQEVDLLEKVLRTLTNEAPPSLRDRVLDTLASWLDLHKKQYMPLWKLQRTLHDARMELPSVLEALQEEGIIEFVHFRTKGRPGEGYKLARTSRQPFADAQQKVGDFDRF